jgi:hypothetical protein
MSIFNPPLKTRILIGSAVCPLLCFETVMFGVRGYWLWFFLFVFLFLSNLLIFICNIVVYFDESNSTDL